MRRSKSKVWNNKHRRLINKVKYYMINNKILIYIGYFKIKEEAVQARDNYIIQNNLPHKLSTDYKKEN